MCLVLFEWNPDRGRGRRLTVAANRDEFFHRPSEPLCEWPGNHGILAGVDRGAELGPDGLPGTWMGVTTRGRFAALTNFRDPRERQTNAASRGQIATGFLTSDLPCAEYLLEVQARAGRYNGFNLLVGEVLAGEPQLWWYSNRAHRSPLKLPPGIYGLSNALLDTPWPKLTRGVGGFCMALAAGADPDHLYRVLEDRRQAPDHELPSTGVSLDRERQLSAIFISADNHYGTRASQVLSVLGNGSIDYRERTFAPELDEARATPSHVEVQLQRVALI